VHSNEDTRKIAESRLLLRRRLDLFAGFILLLLLILVVRAVDLMYFQGDRLAKIAEKQSLRSSTFVPPRGSIVDLNNHTLAESIEVYSVYAIASSVKRKETKELAKITGTSERIINKNLAKHKGFVWLIRDVSPEVSRKVSHAHFQGIGVEKEWKRYQPHGRVTGNLIGFVNRDGKGVEGLEYGRNKHLSGVPGKKIFHRDARGHVLPGLEWEERPMPGADLKLSIDLTVQSIAFEAVKKAVKAARAKAGSAVVLRPSDGAILAISTYPSFDPNALHRTDPSSWRNRPVLDVMEPGSTMKPFTMSAALQSGKFTKDSALYCENGSYRIANRVIHDDHPAKYLTMTGIIQKSSNICSAKIAQAIGAPYLHSVLTSIGFGSKTGSAIPGESPGIVNPVSKWGPVELATIAFGQGIAVTPLQLASAYSVLANGGVLKRPYIFAEEDRSKPKRIFDQKIAFQVRDMLLAATKYGGTGTAAVPPGYLVAGKTGTAQKPSPRGGYSNRYIGVFAGYVPANDPQLVIVVMIDEPRSSHYGGVVAAPAFKEIASSVLPYYGVIPDQKLIDKVKKERREYYRKLNSTHH